MSKYHKPQKLSAKPPKFSKHHLRADGLLLLSSALRSCLGIGIRPAVLGALAVIAGGVASAQSTDVFAESLTLTIPSEPLTLDITPTAEGIFQESDIANFSVTTDALAGYKLTISSKNSSNALANSEGGSSLQSIAAPIAETGAESSFTTNRWGYFPSKFNSSSNTDYRPGPNGTATTLDTTSTKNGDSPTNYTIKLGAKVDTTIPYGNYSNTFVLTATTNPTTYSVKYHNNANGSGADGEEGVVTGMPTDVGNGTTYETTVEVVTGENPKYDGHRFLGWCDTAPTRDDTGEDSCSGMIYGNADSVGIAATATGDTTWTLTGATNALNLYAMWEKEAKQNQTANFKCSSLSAVGDTSTITDDRDGNTYTVAKLADGLCWLTQNLRLGDNTKLKNRTLTSNDTDLPEGTTYRLPGSSTSGFDDDDADDVYVGSNTTYGGYYTWIAATARTGSSISTNSAQAAGSICPKGWRLPTKDEFGNLVSKYGGSSAGYSLLRFPASFNHAGYYANGSQSSGQYDRPGASRGEYWSSTTSNTTTKESYRLYLYDSIASASTGVSWHFGFPIRCVAKE